VILWQYEGFWWHLFFVKTFKTLAGRSHAWESESNCTLVAWQLMEMRSSYVPQNATLNDEIRRQADGGDGCI